MQFFRLKAFFLLITGVQLVNICAHIEEKPFSIGIIGATGHVGEHAAFLLQERKVAEKLLLWGRNQKKCAGDAEDITEAIPFESSTKVIAVPCVEDIGAADIILITAGEKVQKDQPRDALLKANIRMVDTFIKLLACSKTQNPNSVIIVVTNPPDDITQHTIGLCQRLGYLHEPEKQVIGTGTLLDQKRAQKISNNPNIVVLGEHGEELFIPWSLTEDTHGLSPEEKDTIVEKTKRKSYSMVASKGYTQYAIGKCLVEICTAVRDGGILPVSVWDEEHQVVVSRPTRLGRTGVKNIPKLHLTPEEQNKYNVCVEKRKRMTRTMEDFNE
jgi:malate/lactate dehydrogenase